MKQYLDLCRHVLTNGMVKKDRTGTGTISTFGYQFRCDLSEGFPLLTTKKVFYRGILEELLWIISGSTNIRPLVQKNVRIWNEWPYKKYSESKEFKGETIEEGEEKEEEEGEEKEEKEDEEKEDGENKDEENNEEDNGENN